MGFIKAKDAYGYPPGLSKKILLNENISALQKLWKYLSTPMTVKLCTLGNAGKSIATGHILEGLAGLKNGCAVTRGWKSLLVTVRMALARMRGMLEYIPLFV